MLSYFSESIKLSQELGLKLTQIDNYKSLYEMYYLQNDAKNALIYYQSYVNLRDSIFNGNKPKEKPKENLLAETKELILKKQYLKKANEFKLLGIGSGGLIIILLLIVFYQQIRIRQLK